MDHISQDPLLLSQRPKRQATFLGVFILFVIMAILLLASRVFMKLALIDASQKGNLHVVSLLLKVGADPNADDEGQTPLLMAVEGQHLDVVRLLVTQGADTEKRGAFGDTPLTASVGNNYAPIVRFLLDHGANVNAKNTSGETLLMEAASNADSELVQVLLAYHANVNLQNTNGQTALMQAVSVDIPVKTTDLVSTVQILVDHGTNMNVVDNQGQTALMLAQHYNHPRVAEVLEQANKE